MVSCAGTSWPLPEGWARTGDLEYSGAGGVLHLATRDGDLLDPARCRAAERAQPGSWRLLGSRNGVVMCGDYTDAGARVLAFVTRCDPPEGADWSFPEVQATYVFNPKASSRVA